MSDGVTTPTIADDKIEICIMVSDSVKRGPANRSNPQERYLELPG
jgi:hypothetical protein